MAEHVCEIISEWKQDQLLQNDIKKYVLGNLIKEKRNIRFRHARLPSVYLVIKLSKEETCIL